jgi:hypothetical protein
MRHPSRRSVDLMPKSIQIHREVLPGPDAGGGGVRGKPLGATAGPFSRGEEDVVAWQSNRSKAEPGLRRHRIGAPRRHVNRPSTRWRWLVAVANSRPSVRSVTNPEPAQRSAPAKPQVALAAPLAQSNAPDGGNPAIGRHCPAKGNHPFSRRHE